MVKSAQFIAHPTFAVWATCQLQTQTRPTPNINNFSFVMRTQDDQDLGPDDGPRTCCNKTTNGAADLEQDLGPRAHLTCCTAKMAAEFGEIMVQRTRGSWMESGKKVGPGRERFGGET